MFNDKYLGVNACALQPPTSTIPMESHCDIGLVTYFQGNPTGL